MKLYVYSAVFVAGVAVIEFEPTVSVVPLALTLVP